MIFYQLHGNWGSVLSLSGQWPMGFLSAIGQMSGSKRAKVATSHYFLGKYRKNVSLTKKLCEITPHKQMTLSLLAFACILSKGEDNLPLIGSLSPAHIQETLQSLNIRLSEDTIKEIEEAIPENEIAGASFPNREFKNGKAVHA